MRLCKLTKRSYAANIPGRSYVNFARFWVVGEKSLFRNRDQEWYIFTRIRQVLEILGQIRSGGDGVG